MRLHTLSNHTLSKKAIHFLGAIFLGLLMLFASAQVRINLGYVPFTMQTAVVLLIGLLYTPRNALAATCAYAVLCLLGMPMLSGVKSIYENIYTIGYIVGFIPSAYLVAHYVRYCSKNASAHNGLKWQELLVAGFISVAIVLFCGVLWLSHMIGLKAAIISGVLPFILSGTLKTIFAIGIYKTYNSLASF